MNLKKLSKLEIACTLFALLYISTLHSMKQWETGGNKDVVKLYSCCALQKVKVEEISGTENMDEEAIKEADNRMTIRQITNKEDLRNAIIKVLDKASDDKQMLEKIQSLININRVINGSCDLALVLETILIKANNDNISIAKEIFDKIKSSIDISIINNIDDLINVINKISEHAKSENENLANEMFNWITSETSDVMKKCENLKSTVRYLHENCANSCNKYLKNNISNLIKLYIKCMITDFYELYDAIEILLNPENDDIAKVILDGIKGSNCIYALIKKDYDVEAILAIIADKKNNNNKYLVKQILGDITKLHIEYKEKQTLNSLVKAILELYLSNENDASLLNAIYWKINRDIINENIKYWYDLKNVIHSDIITNFRKKFKQLQEDLKKDEMKVYTIKRMIDLDSKANRFKLDKIIFDFKTDEMNLKDDILANITKQDAGVVADSLLYIILGSPLNMIRSILHCLTTNDDTNLGCFNEVQKQRLYCLCNICDMYMVQQPDEAAIFNYLCDNRLESVNIVSELCKERVLNSYTIDEIKQVMDHINEIKGADFFYYGARTMKINNNGVIFSDLLSNDLVPTISPWCRDLIIGQLAKIGYSLNTLLNKFRDNKTDTAEIIINNKLDYYTPISLAVTEATMPIYQHFCNNGEENDIISSYKTALREENYQEEVKLTTKMLVEIQNQYDQGMR